MIHPDRAGFPTQPTRLHEAPPAPVFDLDAALEEAATAMRRASAAGKDTRALSQGERESALASLSRALGLNPLTNPVRFIALQGGEALYVTRQATDQIAARLKINRETVVGPEIRDIGGVKMVFCQVRASEPGQGGRSDVATATIPLKDPCNDLMKCECVPLDSEILTRRGFKRHNELAIGEEVLAYSADADRCEWVPLENVTVYPEAPVFRFATERGGFSMRCTRDHSWAVDTQGAQGRKLMEANAVKTHHRVRIAARAVDGGADLSPDDAAILGWVMCDGTIQRRGSFMRLGIYQSKPARVAEIRALLTRSGRAFTEAQGEATVRTFPGGNTSECLPQHAFWFTADTSRALFASAGIEGPADLPRLATHLSGEARRAMLNAMMAADGSGSTFGKKRKPGVMEAWQILCTLEGVALGKMGESSAGAVPQQRMLSYDYVAGSNLTLAPDGAEAVWCPTTKHGTWVMRQGGRISITGNTKAKRRATLSLVGLGLLTEDDAEAARDSDATPAANEDPTVAWLDDLRSVGRMRELRVVYNAHTRGLRVRGLDGCDDVRAWLRARGLDAIGAEVTSILSTMPEALLNALDDAALEPTEKPDPTPDTDAITRAARLVKAAGSDLHSTKQAWTILARSYGVATGASLRDAGAKLKDLCEKPDPDEPPPTGTDGPRSREPGEDDGEDPAGYDAHRAAQDSQPSAEHAWRETAAGITAHVASLSSARHLEASARRHLREIREDLTTHAVHAYAGRAQRLSHDGTSALPWDECVARVETWLREGPRVEGGAA